MRDAAKALAAVALVLALVAVGCGLSVRNYRECRAHGFSRWYCYSHEVGRS